MKWGWRRGAKIYIYIHIIILCYYYMDELSERAGGMMDAYYVGKHRMTGERGGERERSASVIDGLQNFEELC